MVIRAQYAASMELQPWGQTFRMRVVSVLVLRSESGGLSPGFKAVAILDAGSRDSLLNWFENYVVAPHTRQQLLVINWHAKEQSYEEGNS